MSNRVRLRRLRGSSLRYMTWFCGVGGDTDGAAQVPGIDMSDGSMAANHEPVAIASHAANFPSMEHYRGDIRDAPVENWPVCEIFWASPECPQWSSARGKRRDYAYAETIPGLEHDTDEAAERSRALMEEVPAYLAGVRRRGGLVLAGVVENVIEVRSWIHWGRWLGDIQREGYDTKVIAFNSMHAQGTKSKRCPQSRNRLYVAYWHRSLGRAPDWDKWLRPAASCPSCGNTVAAVQQFKRRGVDMGRYGSQWFYRCPTTACRGQRVEPAVLPAAAAIDWDIEAPRIGDRPKTDDKPDGLKPATIARIRAGIDRHWAPLLVPSGGTWRTAATPLAEPMPTRTTRETDGIALPGLLVPVEGRDGKTAAPVNGPMRTQTARNETGLALPPVTVTMRGGGSLTASGLAGVDPLGTVSAGGNHHGLIEPPLLVPYYSKATTHTVDDVLGTLSTRDRYALVMRCNNNRGSGAAMSTPVTEPARTITASGRQALLAGGPVIDIDEVRFRMLEPHEIAAGMAFRDDYIVTGSKRQRVRQLGNAVTPPVAELLLSALVETITGEDLERRDVELAA